MGTYKVIQDIEAEDKLLGPLTLRQFIYAVIVVVSMFVGFKMATTIPGAGKYSVVILLPHTIFFAVLAAPFGHDQSNEIWLLAKIRFALKPRKRIWDQSGIKELVTITVPKKIERQLTKNFTQDEVQSRLSALANTIDSRGWAVKNVNENLFQQAGYGTVPDSDRLVTVSDIPREVPIEEVGSSFDILDEFDNPTNRHMGQLIDTSTQVHHDQLITMMQPQQVPSAEPVAPSGSQQWFAPNSQQLETSNQEAVTTQVAPSMPQALQQQPQIQSAQPLPQAAIVNEQVTSEQQIVPNAESSVPSEPQAPQPVAIQPDPTVLPQYQPSVYARPQPQVASPVTPVTNPAIINLATNDDLNVATIARQADKAAKQSNDEVVISLH